MTELITGELLDTPEKVAAGFKRAIEQLRTDGKIKSPEVVAFMEAASRAADAIAASPWASRHPDNVRELMQRATILATAAGGIMDGVLGTIADKSQLN